MPYTPQRYTIGGYCGGEYSHGRHILRVLWVIYPPNALEGGNISPIPTNVRNTTRMQGLPLL